jgi:hypothetical protein
MRSGPVITCWGEIFTPTPPTAAGSTRSTAVTSSWISRPKGQDEQGLPWTMAWVRRQDAY